MAETNIDHSPTITEEAALYQVRDGIAVITLNRPEALNAVNSALSTAVGLGLEAAAQAWGLVNHVVPADQVLDAAIALGEKIAANAPLSIAHTKRMVQRAQLGMSDWDSDWRGEDPWALNAEATEAVFSSADAIEGPTAFAEKRAPVWQGR